MIHMLKQEASAHGDKLQIIPVNRLRDLKKEIDLFSRSEELNGFQKWIVSGLYRFELPDADFNASSVIIIAIPHPSYAKVEFIRQGRKYYFNSLIMSEFEKTEKYLNDFLAPKKYHLKSIEKLLLKRLPVQAGLAVYGRNNICYVEGMGSVFSLAAYISDIECDTDDWREMRHSDECTHCRICLNNCPTGAIRADRFLIDNEKCLSYFNESTGEFPEWIPLSAHHCVYDCLKCQISCPMNKNYMGNVTESIKFSEDETHMLLSGSPFETFSPDLKQKARVLGLDQWINAIPRNLSVLFESNGTT